MIPSEQMGPKGFKCQWEIGRAGKRPMADEADDPALQAVLKPEPKSSPDDD